MEKVHKDYVFHEGSIHDSWDNVGGVYIFSAYSKTDKMWEAIYVGKTNSLKTRLNPNHEKWALASKLHSAHVVLAAEIQNPSEREAVEKELIDEFGPRLNVQHN